MFPPEHFAGHQDKGSEIALPERISSFTSTRIRQPAMGRFLDFVDFDSHKRCWLWTGSIQRSGGYGQFTYHNRQWMAHRFLYTMLRGHIPRPLVIDHLCRTRHCVNPDHMEVVTNAENIRRGHSGRLDRDRTHCPQGHPRTTENKYIKPNGYSSCRPCAKERTLTRNRRMIEERRANHARELVNWPIAMPDLGYFFRWWGGGLRPKKRRDAERAFYVFWLTHRGIG